MKEQINPNSQNPKPKKAPYAFQRDKNKPRETYYQQKTDDWKKDEKVERELEERELEENKTRKIFE